MPTDELPYSCLSAIGITSPFLPEFSDHMPGWMSKTLPLSPIRSGWRNFCIHVPTPKVGYDMLAMSDNALERRGWGER